MGVLNPSQPTKGKSRRTSTAPPSSAPSSTPPSDHSEAIAALTAKLDELREAGETDRATLHALRDELAALKAGHTPAAPASEQPTQGRSFREFFGGTH
jgi:hypothetical protein